MISSPATLKKVLNKYDVGVQSECGKLDCVLMHRPGSELQRLRENNLDHLLYDAIPDINQTHKSHDSYTRYLQNNGTHVLYVKNLLLETLSASRHARQALIDGIISHCCLESNRREALLTALREWLSTRTPEQLVADVITGVTRSQRELGASRAAQNILDESDPTAEFIIPPLPNLLFTRDAFSIVEKLVFIWNMAKPARRNEPLIFRVIFRYHPQLATSGLKIMEWQTTDNERQLATIEGGDVAYLGQGVLLIGCGERTNQLGIEALARTGVFTRIIVVQIPPQRDYMHLDTVLSSVGKHEFTLHGLLANTMEVRTVEARDGNNNLFASPKWDSHGSDVRLALQKLLNDNELTFYDAVDVETSIVEQRECRHNVLAIDDRHVMTYAGGHSEKGIVSQMLRGRTCSVGIIPPEGLLEGGGGAHCMTNAIRRRAK